MSFRKPEEDDEGQTFEEGNSGGGSGSITEETVRFGDEQVTVADALRLTGDVVMNPDTAGGFATDDDVAALEKKVAELRGENTELRKANNDLRSELEKLRSDVAALWEAVGKEADGRVAVPAKDGSTGYLPESFDAIDPVGDADA
jgi:dynactin complex subunit